MERNVTFMSGYITFEERLEIESMIFQRCSFGEIAKKINKDRSTISREIRRHSVIEKSGYSGFGFNACMHKETCKMGMVCGEKCVKTSCKLCRTCGHCNDYCPEFAEQVCIVRIKPPYVCNGCEERNKCTLEKTIYSAVQANIMAEQEISSSRKGALCDEAEIARLNAFVTPLILNGQSIHQIFCNNADTLMCSEKTLYNYIDAGFFDARNIDLPRKVRYRPRRKKKEFKVDRGCYIGRSYEEYQKLLNKKTDIHPAQMDSVIGTVGGKVLLTIHFPHTSFMMGFLRDFNTSQSVIDIFEMLYVKLGRKLFEKIFPVILTDRGSEFSNPRMIEFTKDGIRRTSIYYCDAGCPHQKGSIEVNHELIRRVLPKGVTFDDLTQENVDVMMNHINSYSRLKLGNKTPFEAFEFYYGSELFEKLGYKQVEKNQVIINPKLLKR